jgi:hypothetical protein
MILQMTAPPDFSDADFFIQQWQTQKSGQQG